ncbi:ead/Ea22-like family protein [Lelliottia amnigena]|nr:ead/Ea22-like family protein [Lelliottia amnigena]
MTTNKQTLREAAEKAAGAHERLSIMPEGDIFDISLVEGTQLDEDITALNAFNDAANPATVLALLDELEAAERRNAELEMRFTALLKPTMSQLIAGKRQITTTGKMSRLMLQRLADIYRAMIGAAATDKGE